MKKMLLKVMNHEGQIQEGIIEMVSSSCTSYFLHCRLDDGVKKNSSILDSENDVKISHIEYVKPYLVDTDETPKVEDNTPKGEKFHRSAIIKENVEPVKKDHIYTEEELADLDEDTLEELAELFSIDTTELFDHEIIEAILERQKHSNS